MVPEIKLEKPTSIPDCAARLCNLGYYPVPIPLGSKGPSIIGWDKLRLTADQCAAYFADAGLIGCLHTNLACFDIDVTDPVLSAVIVAEAMRRFPGALERIGKDPKSAIVLRLEEPGFKVHNTEKHEKVSPDGELFTAQVEVRTTTRQMAVYGPHPDTGKPYRWTRGELWETPRDSIPEIAQAEAQDFRDWCNKKIREWAGVETPSARIFDIGDYKPTIVIGDDRASEPEFLEALSYVPASMDYGSGWLEALMAIHDFFHGSLRGLEAAKAWSSVDPRYNPAEVEAKWRSFESGKGVSYRAIFHHAQQNGANLSNISRKHKRKPEAGAADEGPKKPAATDADIESGKADWKEGLVVNSRGRVIFNTSNVMMLLMHDEFLQGRFSFNEFAQTKIVAKPLPGSRARNDLFIPRPIKDSDVTQVVAYFNRTAFPDASKGVVFDGIDAIAETNAFHPVRDYFASLEPWDKVERISHWLFDYCACDAPEDSVLAYISEVGRRWMISAVARIMRPGCKADGVLILEGKQGARKSTALRVLASDDWFGDSLPSMSGKDASDYLRGKWIIEMAELSNINKSEVEIVKAFISREEERFRPAYGRNEIRYARQCVFAGTTNKGDYLRDETGNRRFWPVKVGDLCDTDGLLRDRDQLWAEALHAFNAGEPWWLTGDAVRTAQDEQVARVSQDAWDGDVMQYLAGKSEASPTDIAKEALKIDVGRIDRVTVNRITAILAQNGFARSGKFTAGENKGRARFTKVAP